MSFSCLVNTQQEKNEIFVICVKLLKQAGIISFEMYRSSKYNLSRVTKLTSTQSVKF